MSDVERAHMELAVAEAERCVAEDAKVRPKVAAVVARGSTILAHAFRGELSPGNHAEYTLLEGKLSGQDLAGSVLYTTLEPCTHRNHPKVPCVHRVISSRVDKVVIGMLDPSPNILGRGVLYLRQAGIAVEFFPSDLMRKLESINRDFTRVHGASLAPAVNQALLHELEGRSLDDWYVALNRIYWNRNFQRDAAAMLAHLVEVMGSLSVLVSKKKVTGAPVHKTVAKALAWWFALCGKVGVKSVESLLWGKFPYACPYCRLQPHDQDKCTYRKKTDRGPDWAQLETIGRSNASSKPRTLAQWQRMFAAIYPPSSTEDLSRVFAKLTEEIGELAEAVRVFPAAPGYFLSEAADVFAWLMKINNVVDAEQEIAPDQRGELLQETLASAYPSRCVDCNAAICACPPILGSTVGRIAHEVPPERSSYGDLGSFMTAEKAAEMFGMGRSPKDAAG